MRCCFVVLLTFLFIGALGSLVFAGFWWWNHPTKYSDANQEYHQWIHKLPIERIVLRSPQYNKTKYGIVLLVISAEYEHAERLEIRNQWASIEESNMQKTGKSRVIFLVGISSNVKHEAATYGDILQINIKETYRNLVYKIEAGFRWINENLDSEFVAKIDSDTVVHIDRLYERLTRYQELMRGRDWLACHSVYKGQPHRSENSPWYVSKSDYPRDNYPRYCSGPGYVMKKSTFDKIVRRASVHKVLEVEDVFLTGVVGKDVGVYFIGQDTTSTSYTERSNCDRHGPVLSILNTHYQLGPEKSRRNLTAAWEILKNPQCNTRYRYKRY